MTAETLLDAHLVEALAVAAAKRLPTLDYGLLKSRTGAVRPIGAPHRNGGRSELLSPADPRRAAALLTPASCRNPSEAFTRLLLIIDALPAREDFRPRVVGRDEVAEVLDDRLGPRLAGTPNTVLDRDTMALLTRRPPADQVSEVCGSLLTRLALRRWTLPMVERLLDDRRYREGGLLHLCTAPGVGTLRVALDQADVEEKLERQWARCVAYAATLPYTEESLQRTETIAETVALVEQLQQAADACPQRWATESGPADRAALDLFCLLALRSGSTVLSLDVRRAALATGHGRSTMHRAFGRLTLDSWLGRATDDGPAGTYELLPVTASHPAFASVARGGTQGTPPPQGRPAPPCSRAFKPASPQVRPTCSPTAGPPPRTPAGWATTPVGSTSSWPSTPTVPSASPRSASAPATAPALLPSTSCGCGTCLSPHSAEITWANPSKTTGSSR
ncbi:hypothetical protein [Streptomyces musisoli]|uniref:hypothetical protein n=1 Tax=Streptomyces musisoli TaxID=2802280 RepID=UPI001F3987E2|nr:hypothetical protein [Streptomyces musisoli]